MALPKKTKEFDSVVAAYAQVCRLPTFDEPNYIFSDVAFRTIIQTYRILKIEGEGFGYVQ